MSAPLGAGLTAARDTGIEGEVSRAFLGYLVSKQITCAKTKSVLDVRSTVAVEVTETSTDRIAALQVTTAAAYDQSGAALAEAWAETDGYTVTVYDGRTLFGGGR